MVGIPARRRTPCSAVREARDHRSFGRPSSDFGASWSPLLHRPLRFLIHDRDSRYGAGFDHRIDRVPWRGVAEWPPRSSGMGRIGQLAIAGKLTAGSLPNGAMVSSVMYRPRWTAHGDVAEWLKAVC
jgi:hypothetical protein